MTTIKSISLNRKWLFGWEWKIVFTNDAVLRSNKLFLGKRRTAQMAQKVGLAFLKSMAQEVRGE